MPSSLAAIIPAAGLSRRMGQPKQLLPVAGSPAIRTVIRSFLDAGIGSVCVVINPAVSGLAEAIADLPVITAVNDNPASDMAASVRIGLAALGSESDILVLPADHLLVTPALVGFIRAEAERYPGKIVIPVHKGIRGHPTFFPRALINELFSNLTLRDIIAQHHDRLMLLDVPHPGAVMDADTPEEYEELTKSR